MRRGWTNIPRLYAGDGILLEAVRACFTEHEESRLPDGDLIITGINPAFDDLSPGAVNPEYVAKITGSSVNLRITGWSRVDPPPAPMPEWQRRPDADNLHVLYEANHRDIPATLRLIANNIEAGKYGEVGACGLVLLGDETKVFGMGPDSDAPSIALLLHAGFLRLSRAIEEHGR